MPNVTAALSNTGSSSGRQPNCGVEQRPPPIFGRAAMTLGIGPHSSLGYFGASFELGAVGQVHCLVYKQNNNKQKLRKKKVLILLTRKLK